MKQENKRVDIGLDVGSVSLNTVVLNEAGVILEEHYTRLKGQPVKTTFDVLTEVLKHYPPDKINRVAVTGSGGKLIAELLGGQFINEIVAQAKAVEHLYPQVKTIIDIGGEDSKLILLKSDSGRTVIEDFSMNTICAAGTGLFLDQQARRLGLSIEGEFGDLALKSKNPPRIAGRCSVFAKTDMIHLQQQAAPDYDIVAGLCYALARNFKSNIGKGKEFPRPIIFQGGVAANRGMVNAFEDVLGEKLIIPKHYASMGAIGALFILKEKKTPNKNEFKGLEALSEYLKGNRNRPQHLSPLSCPLGLRLDEFKTRVFTPLEVRCVNASAVASGDLLLTGFTPLTNGGTTKINVYLGIDVGSTSTKMVAIDEEGRLVARIYLMTAGRPLEAVQKCIREIGEKVGGFVNVMGAGTTGSGRYLIGDFVGADLVKNEITAQAIASAEIDPEVDTIFEIGGQDSKFISLDRGVVIDFEMNKVCAAGTGSFLEEQAEGLSIKINEEFGELAFSGKCPVRLGERCTVFIESNLLSHQQSGVEKENLVAGLAYSIVENYLNRVVGHKKIGKNIFFQGAVALNQAVVAAFEKVLTKKITVPPNPDITGAIGVALCVQKERKKNWKNTSFKGFDAIANAKYELHSFECPDCPNHCEIREVVLGDGKSLFYGSRCEKYNIGKKKVRDDIPDLFKEREKLLLTSYQRSLSTPHPSAKIGIPRALTFHELYPFWKAFFSELGFEVVFSDPTNKKIISEGLESVVVEACFPVKVAHGHILNLLGKKVDYIFLPVIVNMKQTNFSMDQSYNCPYVQTLSYFIKSAINTAGVKIIDSELFFGWGKRITKVGLQKLGKSLGKSPGQIEKAILAAEKTQDNFYKAVQQRGREILNSLDGKRHAVVIVARAYNGCDTGINLNLPQKLRDLGALPIPMDYLPLDSVDLSKDFPDMYWRCGQKILSAGEIIRKDNRLQALYITNFGCGPDSFIIRFFREKMSQKPYLQIEIDEHSADVGAITRCEAFLDSLSNVKVEEVIEDKKRQVLVFSKEHRRTVYIPWMGDHAFALKAAFEANGVLSQVFPESDTQTLEYGRKFTSGKECYPCIVTTGDMVKLTKSPGFDPKRIAFFMPTASGPCRFGQYHKLQRIILDELGLEEIPIISPNQAKNLYQDLGMHGRSFVRQAWEGIVAIDLLDKLQRERRPYEINKGETGEIYQRYLKAACQAIRTKKGLSLVLKEATKAFQEIKTEGMGEKPKIGIIGEIFVRNHKFSNDYLVNQVEELGGEVWMPPFTEWIFHVNRGVKLHSLMKRDYALYFKTALKDKLQRHLEHHLSSIASEALLNGKEPSLEEIWKNAQPYLPCWFGESALSLGKSRDYFKKGVSGIINVMPFTCLMGMITTSALKRFREDHKNIPCLVMAYDGLEQTNMRTRLEAFIYQAKAFQKEK